MYLEIAYLNCTLQVTSADKFSPSSQCSIIYYTSVNGQEQLLHESFILARNIHFTISNGPYDPISGHYTFVYTRLYHRDKQENKGLQFNT
jgi:hypothetical protein